MGNIATTIKEQIEKLKSRGMTLDFEEDKVKEILLDVGYYRLGFYWNPFEIDKNHNFKEGTKFSDVVALYYLDVDPRNLLLKYINRIEINFRTKLVYYTSNIYKKSPVWFIDPEVMHKSFIDKIDDHYNDEFKNSNKAIKLHHQKYINDKYAPAWKTLEFFTFGASLKVFKSLKEESTKQRVAKEYGVLNIDRFINLINTIVFVRNACAHGNVLFDLQTPKGISKLPQIDFQEKHRHSLYSCIKVILYFLEKVSGGRKNDLILELEKLFEIHKDKEVIRDIIIEKIGYEYSSGEKNVLLK